MDICRGEAFPLEFRMFDNENEPITSAAVDEVELTIGDNINKKLSKGEITFNSETNYWTANLSSAETSLLERTNYAIYVWVTFTGETEHRRVVCLDSVAVKDAK